MRGFYLSHEFTALAKWHEVVERERPAVCGRQVHIDSATAQPAHSQSGVALKFAPPRGDLFAPRVGKGIKALVLSRFLRGACGLVTAVIPFALVLYGHFMHVLYTP